MGYHMAQLLLCTISPEAQQQHLNLCFILHSTCTYIVVLQNTCSDNNIFLQSSVLLLFMAYGPVIAQCVAYRNAADVPV